MLYNLEGYDNAYLGYVVEINPLGEVLDERLIYSYSPIEEDIAAPENFLSECSLLIISPESFKECKKRIPQALEALEDLIVEEELYCGFGYLIEEDKLGFVLVDPFKEFKFWKNQGVITSDFASAKKLFFTS